MLNNIKGDVIIYGSGIHTKNLLGSFNFESKKILSIVDKNNFSKFINGYKVEPVEKLNKLKNKTIIISSYSF